MKQEKPTWRLRLVDRSYLSFDTLSVYRFPLAYDEELEAVFPAYNPFGTYTKEITLDAEFYLRELMNLDATNEKEILRFMDTWGMLTSPFRSPLIPGQVLNASIATPEVEEVDGKSVGYPVSTPEAFRKACDLRDKINARHNGVLAHAQFDFPLETYKFAPMRECVQSVEWLQQTIDFLVRMKREGTYETGAYLDIDVRNAREHVITINRLVTPYFPLSEIVTPYDEKTASSTSRAVTLPLSIAVLAQLIIGLRSDDGYRVCPECGQVFMYKRNSNGISSRDPRARYCSAECQRAFNRKKDVRRNHAKKKEDQS